MSLFLLHRIKHVDVESGVLFWCFLLIQSLTPPPPLALSHKEPKAWVTISDVTLLQWCHHSCCSHGNRAEAKRQGGEYTKHATVHVFTHRLCKLMWFPVSGFTELDDEGKQWSSVTHESSCCFFWTLYFWPPLKAPETHYRDVIRFTRLFKLHSLCLFWTPAVPQPPITDR